MNQVMCKVDGCKTAAMYTRKELCQKHYFRMMRNGSFEKKNPEAIDRVHKVNHSSGYILLKYNGHPLAQKRGYVFEHRKVIYDVYGEMIPPCELCGEESSWTSRKTHIDHIDGNRANNSLENLRILCNPCNSRRGRKKAHEYPGVMAVTVFGETKTANEWAKERDVDFCGASIKRRIRSGMSHKEAVFGEKLTHKFTLNVSR